MASHLSKKRMVFYAMLLQTNMATTYGYCHVNRPSKFWPDEETNSEDELNRWRSDLCKEYRGDTEFNGSWGLGTNFETPNNIVKLLQMWRKI